MTQVSSYLSEVYIDGTNYPFRAQIQPNLWTAQVLAADATRLCSLSCTVPPLEQDVDSIEDAVAEWVHQSVTCLLGVSSNATARCEAAPARSAWSALEASNTAAFVNSGPVTSLVPAAGAVERTSTLRSLDARSRAVIDQFWSVARAYNDVRNLIPVEKPRSSAG